ncbi:hypothetical protein C8R43DRAFT_1138459 [Mycena crocata]|nr:hypothetical protein C8R43DRAFT_1138459 [Mycena crocata]
MSNLSHSLFKHGDLHQGEHYENLDYLFLTSLLSQTIVFYDTCYQFHSPSPDVDDPNNIWDNIPDLVDENGHITPSHGCRPKECAWRFAKL